MDDRETAELALTKASRLERRLKLMGWLMLGLFGVAVVSIGIAVSSRSGGRRAEEPEGSAHSRQRIAASLSIISSDCKGPEEATQICEAAHKRWKSHLTGSWSWWRGLSPI